MKNFIKIVSALSAVLILFSACGKDKKDDGNSQKTTAANAGQSVSSTDIKKDDKTEKTEKEKATKKNSKKFSVNYTEKFTDKGKKIIASMGSSCDYKAILEDNSEIDFKLKPDLNKSKYTIKNVKDEQNSTNTVQYYKNGKLVYEVLEGFGEECYINHTKTKSGKDAKVYYYHANGEIFNVIVETADSKTNYDRFDKSKKNEPQTIIIEAKKKTAGKLDESVMYTIDSGVVTLEDALYYGNGGYMHYTSWVDIDGKLDEFEEVKIADEKVTVSTDVMKQIRANSVYAIQTLIGSHKLTNSGGKWYMTSDLYVLFSDEDQAKGYASKNGLSADSVSNEYACDDSTYYVKYKNVSFPFSSSFKLNGADSFDDFAAAEFDDSTFANISINTNNEITAIDYDNSTLSRY